MGESTSAVITRFGGGVVLRGQQGAGTPFWLTFQANAVSIDTTVSVTETTVPPPIDYIDYSPVYFIEPSITIAVPAKLVVPYSNDGRDMPGNLAIYTASTPTGPFSRLADSRDSSGFAEGTISQLGRAVFVGYPKTAEQQNCP